MKMRNSRDIVTILFIALPWTLLVTVWHWSTVNFPLTPREDDRQSSRSSSQDTSAVNKMCCPQSGGINYTDSRPPPWSNILPMIFVITPTYARPVQKAELTRLANTLLHMSNLHWILVEDSERKTPLVSGFLQRTGLNYTHLNVQTPKEYKFPANRGVPHGTLQRNLALQWLRDTFSTGASQSGVVYFADDDNAYSLELFDEIRTTKTVSVWPVAFVGGLRYEAPKVNALGRVYGWKALYAPERPFCIDMAGFAVNLHLILSKPQANFQLYGVKTGYQESSLLTGLVTLDELEPKAANCTKILAWHTRTEAPQMLKEDKDRFTDHEMEI
ncbi:galactosylgalactosylxylosylprotein 3-beta-glucuronosyltransferase 1-like [Cynoglossus semilaevis]|uniref:Galactosylgalactosylxylosylprotein 3-beta-glucuronosyltransferase n=1 Tax=Cynoglossus semilaevis TaxID=244447 RepID=A0A3P8VYB2_CYNSE|nr:galactosylgalactosylxylosylprotein 3-beta-glucuronosyltransferase 1-like [Cynoglossus semilaevis]XP_008336031.2 galactosylgalactosylxylosylprotein 3-beta-glucuronosyltransferase 1-like [Cynoglossus semilaevis]